MKTLKYLAAAAILLSTLTVSWTGTALAQGDRVDRKKDSKDRRSQRDAPKGRINRFERLKQMKLIEDLQLDEEESVRFMVKRREHEKRMAELSSERNRIIDELEVMLEDKADAATLGGQSDRVIAADRKMFDERQSYQAEMKRMLSQEKYSRLLVFERDFQHQVRDAMGKSMKRRNPRFND